MAKRLTSWCADVLNETGLPSLQSVFCGFHEEIVNSAVLFSRREVVGESDDLDQMASQNIERYAKDLFLRIATPFGISLSQTLTSLCDGVDRRLEDVIQKCFVDYDSQLHSERTPMIGSFVMTYSPLILLQKDHCEWMESDAIILNEVKSSEEFVRFLEKKTELVSDLRRAIVIQFDPFNTSPSQIHHATEMCTSFVLSARRRQRNCPLIVFLIHLPPGVRGHVRNFVFDFRQFWEFWFVDDVSESRRDANPRERETKSIGIFSFGVPSFDLIRSPVSSLCENGVIHLDRLIRFLFPTIMCRTAAAYLRPPYVNSVFPEMIGWKDYPSYESRFQLLRSCWDECGSFRNFFTNATLCVLRKHETTRRNGREVTLQTSLSAREFVRGTFSQSVTRAIHEMIIQASCHVLCNLEKNYNFGTIRRHGELWLRLASNPNIFDLNTLALTFSIGGNDSSKRIAIANSGSSGVFVSQFPFSYSIFTFFNRKETKNAIDELRSRNGDLRYTPEAYADVFLNVFGASIGTLCGIGEVEVSRSTSYCYLHDFLAMTVTPYADISYGDLELIRSSCLVCSDASVLHSPNVLHSQYHRVDKMIRCVCAIFRVLPPSLRLELSQIMLRIVRLEDNFSLVQWLSMFFKSYFDCQWSSIRGLSYFSGREIGGNVRTISRNIETISKDVDSLLFDPSLSDFVGFLKVWSSEWLSIKILQIFFNTFLSNLEWDLDL
jgi:hypothetical protein